MSNLVYAYRNLQDLNTVSRESEYVINNQFIQLFRDF